MRNSVLALMIVVLSSASGYVSGYHVEPVKASWSGWTGFQDTVTQTVTCNFDSVSYCELFAGETLTGHSYIVDVFEAGGPRVAYNLGEHATKPQSWVHIPLTTVSGKTFTKGKQYEFRFTRGGSHSGA